MLNRPELGGHDHEGDLELARERDRVGRAGAAERQQREPPRVAAALAGDGSHRLAHVRHGDAVRAERRLGDADAERVGDGRDRLLGQARVDRLGSAGERLLVEVAEHDERVGQRRLFAAKAVAGRARGGAGAVRADARSAALVDPDHASAAGADLGDVERGHADGVAAALRQPVPPVHASADLVFGGLERLAVLDHRGLRGRAAHVEGDGVGQVEPAR